VIVANSIAAAGGWMHKWQSPFSFARDECNP